jgi:hypothetical protein
MGPALMSKLLWLFRCQHEFCWPRRRSDRENYQVCLLCGAEYDYDWSTMQRTAATRRQALRPAATQDSPARPRYRRWQPRERRLRFTGEMQFRAGGSQRWRESAMENISRSGVLFHDPAAEQPLERGTPIELVLEMPKEISGQGGSLVRCQGQVTRCLQAVDGKPGVLIASSIESYVFLRSGRVAALAGAGR